MTPHTLLKYLIELPWIIFVVVWFLAALKTNPTERSESFVSRYGVMALVVAGYVLIFDDSVRVGVLEHRFVPYDIVIGILGVVLTWLGIGLALWARFYLGRFWSARVTIKQDHRLISSGPYARLRHPIYSGLLLALAGSALTKGEWRGLAGLTVVWLAFSFKALKEESMLGEQFGDDFREHRRRTGFLLPRFRQPV